MDEQEDEEDFDEMIHDIQHHHIDDVNSYYAPDDFDEDDNSLGLCESEYVAMDKEECMIVTYDYNAEGGDLSDHE